MAKIKTYSDDNTTTPPSKTEVSDGQSLDKTLPIPTTETQNSHEQPEGQEFENTDDDLHLIGKVEVSSSKVEFKDTDNHILAAHFDTLKNLIIEKNGIVLVYKIGD